MLTLTITIDSRVLTARIVVTYMKIHCPFVAQCYKSYPHSNFQNNYIVPTTEACMTMSVHDFDVNKINYQ